MEVKTDEFHGGKFLTLQSELIDAANASEAKTAILPLLKRNSCIVLDMSNVKMMDSAGIGAILLVTRQAATLGAIVKLCSLQEAPRKIVEMVRLHRVIEIHATREDVLRSFNQ